MFNNTGGTTGAPVHAVLYDVNKTYLLYIGASRIVIVVIQNVCVSLSNVV